MGPRLTGREAALFGFELRFSPRENIARKRDRGALRILRRRGSERGPVEQRVFRREFLMRLGQREQVVHILTR